MSRNPDPDRDSETNTDVLVAGDTLVDFMPDQPRPVGSGGAFEPAFGGSGANVAMALDRLGPPPLFWTRIATDEFGDFLAGRLAESGISNRFIVRDPDAKTTLAFVSHDESGEPQFSFYRSATADTRMQSGTVPDAELDDLSWVHTTGVALSAQPSRSATLELLERSADHGCTVSLDPNSRPEMWHSPHEYAAVVRGALENVDVLKATPGDLSAGGFETDDPERLARQVTERGPETVCITLGESGSVCYGTDASPVSGIARHEGYEAEAVDTTGAGDAFMAGVITALERGLTDGHDVLALANAVGAVVTTEPGASTALTDLDRVHELYGKLPGE